MPRPAGPAPGGVVPVPAEIVQRIRCPRCAGPVEAGPGGLAPGGHLFFFLYV